VMVAPPELKVLSALALVAPGLNATLQHRLGAAKILAGAKNDDKR